MRSSRRLDQQEVLSSLHQLYSATRPRQVLLHEPETAARDRLVAALRRDGYEVLELEEGTDPSRYLGRPQGSLDPFELPDLIIARADAAGFRILSSLRERRERPAVILLADVCDAALQEAASRYGTAYLFQAPMQIEDVRTAAWSLAAP